MTIAITRRAALAGVAGAATTRFGHAAAPITIGCGLSLTGPLAVSGRAIQLSANMFVEDINARGGIAGRPVRLIVYDDQSNPPNAPQIYTKLLDIDKVDLLISNGTNLSAPAMPVVMQRNKVLLVMFALAVNDKFHYPRFFQTMPYGPDGKHAISEGFFNALAGLNPKPHTIALVGADADYAKTAVAGARDHAKRLGLRIVYDRTYPPTTVDYGPTMRGIAAANADVVYVGSYPLDTVGMIRAAHELRIKSMMFGGSMVGTQIGSLKAELGELLNGIVSYELYVPAVAKSFPEVEPFLQRYRPLAVKQGVDPLGFYMPPFAYASLQVLAQAVEAVGQDDAKLADHMHSATFKTLVGDIAFGPGGEWRKPRMLTGQFHGVKGNGLQQFMDPATEVIVDPPEYRTGTVQAPFGAA